MNRDNRIPEWVKQQALFFRTPTCPQQELNLDDDIFLTPPKESCNRKTSTLTPMRNAHVVPPTSSTKTKMDDGHDSRRYERTACPVAIHQTPTSHCALYSFTPEDVTCFAVADSSSSFASAHDEEFLMDLRRFATPVPVTMLQPPSATVRCATPIGTTLCTTKSFAESPPPTFSLANAGHCQDLVSDIRTSLSLVDLSALIALPENSSIHNLEADTVTPPRSTPAMDAEQCPVNALDTSETRELPQITSNGVGTVHAAISAPERSDRHVERQTSCCVTM